jgi:hypothetical protein
VKKGKRAVYLEYATIFVPLKRTGSDKDKASSEDDKIPELP